MPPFGLRPGCLWSIYLFIVFLMMLLTLLLAFGLRSAD